MRPPRSKWSFLHALAPLVAFQGLLVWWQTASRTCYPPGWGEGCSLLKWVYDWQTLLAGCLAIAAALIGGYVVRAQTQQTAEQERERMRRRHAAARAVLPLALSAMCQYAEECAKVLRQLLDKCSGESLPREVGTAAEFPKVPSSATTELKGMVEVADAMTAAAIATVLSKIQVQAAQLAGFNSYAQLDRDSVHVVKKSNIEHYMLRTAEIYARTEALFDFARAEADTASPGPPREDRMTAALRLFRLHHSRYDRMYGDIPRYLERVRRHED